MFLEIKNPDGENLDQFVGWLCDYIQQYADDPVVHQPALDQLWQQYFDENDLGWPVDDAGNPVPPTISYVVDQYFSHLVIARRGEDYIITSDPNLKLGQSQITIDQVASVINYGNLSVPAYPLFDVVFESVADDLMDLYTAWLADMNISEEEDPEGGGTE